MKSSRLLAFAVGGLALVAGLALIRPATAADNDSAQIKQLCSSFVDAFNKHDPKAMAAGFAEDGDTLGHTGELVSGRMAIEAEFAAGHTGMGPLREAKLEVKKEPIRFITPDVALSDAEVVVTGAYGPDGSKAGPMSLHVTNVWKKTGADWKLVASRPFVLPPATTQAGSTR